MKEGISTICETKVYNDSINTNNAKTNMADKLTFDNHVQLNLLSVLILWRLR